MDVHDLGDSNIQVFVRPRIAEVYAVGGIVVDLHIRVVDLSNRVESEPAVGVVLTMDLESDRDAVTSGMVCHFTDVC